MQLTATPIHRALVEPNKFQQPFQTWSCTMQHLSLKGGYEKQLNDDMRNDTAYARLTSRQRAVQACCFHMWSVEEPVTFVLQFGPSACLCWALHRELQASVAPPVRLQCPYPQIIVEIATRGPRGDYLYQQDALCKQVAEVIRGAFELLFLSRFVLAHFILVS